METTIPRLSPDRQVVRSYRDGGFTVSGTRHEGSILVLPDRVLPWPVTSIDGLTPASLEPIRADGGGPDILVLGTGAAFALVPPALREEIRAWGTVIEVMATPAACRTYNLLLAEERRVAAALLALPAPPLPST